MLDCWGVWDSNPSLVFLWCHFRRWLTLVEFTSCMTDRPTSDNSSGCLFLTVQWGSWFWGSLPGHVGRRYRTSRRFLIIIGSFPSLTCCLSWSGSAEYIACAFVCWSYFVYYSTSPLLGSFIMSGVAYEYGIVGKLSLCVQLFKVIIITIFYI